MIRKLLNILSRSKALHLYYKVGAVLGVVLLTIIINSCIPIALKKSIEILSSDNSFELYGYLVGYSILWIGGQLMSNIRTHFVSILLEDLTAQLTLSLFNHLHSLSLRFHLDHKTGALAHTLNNIQSALESLLWGCLVYLIPTILELLIALCVITAFYGLYYACIIGTTFVIFILVTLISRDWTEEAQASYFSKRAAAKTYVVESLSNAETVKYFSGSDFENQQCSSLLAAQKNAARSYSLKSMAIQSMQSLAIGLGLTLTLIVSAYRVQSLTFNVGDFILIQTYILQFLLPLSYIGYLIRQLKRARADLTDALNFFDLSPEINDSPYAHTLTNVPAPVIFSHLSFGYDHNKQILDDCSFTILPGKKLALVGTTGAGKTTIVRLLFRLYEATSGSITINGTNINQVTQASLHGLIGYVPQETLLFNNSLYYNITYGQQNKTIEQVQEAIYLAELDTFIHALPGGLDTIVGNRGLKISGGEKQRIALARVFLKKPHIYILDEATSALDSKTEKKILHNVRTLSKDATTLVIAHRLSSIIDADEIVVLDHGCIVQRGTHQDLVTKPGLYAQMWFTQQTALIHKSSLSIKSAYKELTVNDQMEQIQEV